MNFDIEKDFIDLGYENILGIDEVGRGCLAGPMFLGYVMYSNEFILDPFLQISIVDDSKKLSQKKREKAYKIISENSKIYGIQTITNDELDFEGITNSTLIAIEKIIEKCRIKPDIILVDGNFSFDLSIDYESIVNGDTKSISIASAAIIAKVLRDKFMVTIHKTHTDLYGWDRNKGYGTKEHRDALKEHGISIFHRKSFEPIKTMIKNGGIVM